MEAKQNDPGHLGITPHRPGVQRERGGGYGPGCIIALNTWILNKKCITTTEQCEEKC